MMELIIVLIIVLMYMLPAVAGEDEREPPETPEHGGPLPPSKVPWSPFPSKEGDAYVSETGPANPALGDSIVPPTPPSRAPEGIPSEGIPVPVSSDPILTSNKSKVIIKAGCLYQIQHTDAIRSGNSPIDNEPIIEDLIRFWTYRMWYGYGWPFRQGQQPPSNPEGMHLFGYFPADPLNPNFIINDLKLLHINIAAITDIEYGTLAPPFVPKIFITEFKDPIWAPNAPPLWEISEIAEIDCLEQVLRDVELQNYYVQDVTVQKFPASDYGYGDFDYDFDEFANADLYDFASQTEEYEVLGEAGSVISTLQVPKRYHDFSFSTSLLTNEEFNIHSEYQIYYERYETLINGAVGYEVVLPNIYIIDFASLNIEEYYRMVSLNHPDFDENIPDFEPFILDELTSAYEDLLTNFGYDPAFPYMSLWLVGFASALGLNIESLNQLKSEFKNLIFSSLYLPEYLTVTAARKPTMPMYNEILISNPYGTRELVSLFENEVVDGTYVVFPYDPMTNLISDVHETIGKQQEVWEVQFGGYAEPSHAPGIVDPAEDDSFEHQVRRTWNLVEWFKLYCTPEDAECFEDSVYPSLPSLEPIFTPDFEAWQVDEEKEKAMPVGGKKNSPWVIGGYSHGAELQIPGNESWFDCDSTALVTVSSALSNIYEKLGALVYSNFRTYESVVDGKLAYAEPVFYRVEKLDAGTGEVLQNLFFPATQTDTVFDYLDGQIRFGTYEYKIFAYHFVIGNEYWYVPIVPETGRPETIEEEDVTYVEDGDYEVPEDLMPWQAVIGSYPEGTTGPDDWCTGAARRQVIYDETDNKMEENGKKTVNDPMIGIYPIPTTIDYDPADFVFPDADGETPFLDYWNAFGQPYFNPHPDQPDHPKVPVLVFSTGYGVFLGDLTKPATDPGNTRLWEFHCWDDDDYVGGTLWNAGFSMNDAIGPEGTIPTTISTEADFRSIPESFSALSGLPLYFNDECSGPIAPILFPRYGGIDPSNCCEDVWMQEINGQWFIVDVDVTDFYSAETLRNFGFVLVPGQMGEACLGEAKYGVPEDESEPGEDTGEPLTSVSFTAHTKPELLLIESEITEQPSTIVTVADSPPLPPDMDFVPYRSVNDRFLVLLNGNVGEYQDYPVIIDPQDLDYFTQVAISQGTIEEGEFIDVDEHLITFKNDDYPIAFEIFRLDFPPFAYDDFRAAERIVLYNTIENTIIQTANSVISTIKPNKKYWYTSRAIDVHGNKSNPSGILQVEMIDTGNSIFPVVELYSLPKEGVVYKKPMRKYLMIKPSIIQTTMDPDIQSAHDFNDAPILGVNADQSIWGEKKFKLRVTSKATGKKIDLNFSFKQANTNNTDL